ncbi:MAG: oligosaccharide flippase family protein [Bacteroidota bacterium]
MLSNWRDKLKGEFLRHVVTLFSGTLAAQVFALAILPVLGWYYTPEDFGVRGVYMASLMIGAIAINGGYEYAIMLPSDRREAASLFQLCIYLTLGLSALLGMILWLLGPLFWVFLSVGEMTEWQWLLLLSICIEGLNQPLRIHLNRAKAYRALSISKMIQPILGGGAMVAGGFAGWGLAGLLWGGFIGQIGTFGYLVWAYRNHRMGERWVDFSKIRQVAIQYRDFPKNNILSGILNTLSAQLPIYFLPGLYGKEVAGYFHMAQRALMMPFAIVGKSVADVFYQQAARAYEEGTGKLSNMTRMTAQILGLGGLVPTILIMLLAPTLVDWIFGEKWLETGEMAVWLMPWVYITLLTVPLSFLIDIRRKLAFQLRYNVVLFTLRLAALVVGGEMLTYIGTIQLYAAVCTAMGAILIGYMLRLGYVWEKGKSLNKS